MLRSLSTTRVIGLPLVFSGHPVFTCLARPWPLVARPHTRVVTSHKLESKVGNRTLAPDTDHDSASERHDSVTNAPLAERQLEQILRSDILKGPKKITHRVREEMKTIPKFELSAETSTVDIARETMYSFTEKLRTLPLDAALREVKRERLGEQVLPVMLSAVQSDRERCGRDYRFLYLLAHLVAAEQCETLFWQGLDKMMIRRPKNLISEQSIERDRLSWAGRFIGSLAAVQYVRAVDRNADQAIHTILNFCGLRERYPRFRNVSLGSAYSPFGRAYNKGLTAQPFKNTSPELYDKLLACLVQHGSGGTNEKSHLHAVSRINLARLCLRHPRNADPEDGLEIFRAFARGETPRLGQPRDINEEFATFTMALDVAAVLRNRGRKCEAEWLEKLAHEDFRKISNANGGVHPGERHLAISTGDQTTQAPSSSDQDVSDLRLLNDHNQAKA